MRIKHLLLEGMTINLKEAQMLAHFFERTDCLIEEFELNEAEVEFETLQVIMEAFFKADHLRRLSLSKNSLSPEICSILT
jgi:hypothetical protein